MLSPVETIKERLSIAEVVSSYLKLEKSGANLKAKCPFHHERTASFFVSPARGSYYCFGCGAKGDIFSFVQAFEGLDFVGALKTLATRAGVEVMPENPKTRNERDRLFLLTETATLFFEMELAKDEKARSYITERGVTEKTQRSWRIGFAPDAWRSCLAYCQEKGFTFSEIEKAGLVKTDKGKTYDRFRSRIMFPIFDASGRTVAFSGRILGKESEHIPKYLNSPETPIFSKSRILYGFDRAKTEIRRMDYAMLVEGQMDLLMCHQAGFRNAVASSGTAFTLEQLELLKRLSQRLLMVFDADKAGVNASLRSASLALASGMEVKVAALPEGTDPAELILKDKERFKERLAQSLHVIDFYLESIIREHKTERALLRAIHDKLLPYVAALESHVEQDHFLKRIAERTSIREEALREDLRSPSVPHSISPVAAPSVSLSPRKHTVERLITGLVLWQEKHSSPVLDVLWFKKEVERIAGAKESKALFAEAQKIAEGLIFQAEAYYAGSATLEDAARDLLSAFEEDLLRESLASAMKELSLAEQGSDKEEKQRLRKLCSDITKRLHTVRESR